MKSIDKIQSIILDYKKPIKSLILDYKKPMKFDEWYNIYLDSFTGNQRPRSSCIRIASKIEMKGVYDRMLKHSNIENL